VKLWLRDLDKVDRLPRAINLVRNSEMSHINSLDITFYIPWADEAMKAKLCNFPDGRNGLHFKEDRMSK
jgi:hypothetical protein